MVVFAHPLPRHSSSNVTVADPNRALVARNLHVQSRRFGTVHWTRPVLQVEIGQVVPTSKRTFKLCCLRDNPFVPEV